jgi:hypothetical protein
MIKIAAGLQRFVTVDSSQQSEDSLPTGQGASWREPLVMSLPYLKAVEAALDAEIRRRLVSFPVTAESANALERLRECIAQRIDVCIPLLERLERWYEISLKSTRMNSSTRSILLMSRGNLHDSRGEFDLAVISMRDAAASDPHNISIPIMLAALYIRHEQWDQATAVIEEIENNLPLSGFGSRHVSWLREQYEKRLQASRVELQ